MLDIARTVAALDLKPHPEGGYYRETWRADAAPGQRAAGTCIHFLLEADTFSAWHEVDADEIWLHQGGGPATLHLLDDAGHRTILLGSDLGAGQVLQAVVPAGVLQATQAHDEPALFGCVVCPGFRFEGFGLPSAAELHRRFPDHRDLIARLTRH